MKSGSLSLAIMSPLIKPQITPNNIPADDSQNEIVRQQTRRDHARKPHHRSDREVDSASHDDQGHADGNHRVDRRLQQDVQDVRWLVEAAGKQREDHEKERNTGDDTSASDPFELGALFWATISRRLFRRPLLMV